MKREFTRKATGGIKFETVADLVEHTKGLELKPTYPPDADVNAVVVLPNGVFEFGDNFGFCFFTRNILQNAERARDAWGGSFPGETDGSWKFLYCGWPILAFGTHSIYYDTDKCAIRHKFRPISFMFTKGESEQAFTRLFECTIEAIQLLFTFRIELSTAASDKADAIKAAFARVWPNAKWVTCWPHISMKPRKEWMKLMVAEDKQPVLAALKEYLTRLHKTRSREQFQQLAKLVGYQLRLKKEEQVANILDKEYTSPPYDAWYVTASGVVYCSPSSQPIEAYWKTVKSTKLYQLRARLDNMMHEGIKNWLYLDATTGLCEPISSDNGGVVPPAEVIASAYDKLASNAYNKVAGVYYVNTKEAIDEPVVLNDNGSVRWKFVLIGTWEPPTLHETDMRCYQAQGARSAVQCERAARALGRMARGLCSASNPNNVHGRGVQWGSLTRDVANRRWTRSPSKIRWWVGKQEARRQERSLTRNAVTEGIEIAYVDCDPSDDKPASPAYSPTSPVHCPTSPSDSGAVVPDAPVCTVKDCVRCAQKKGASVTVDPIRETGNEHPAVETMAGGAGGSRGLIVDPPTSSDNDADVAPRRIPKRRRKNVAPNRAKYPLAKHPRR
ncbi:hypothetical protein CYMTET_12528 [Cymbomonas tetramitiformis]|uniref:MULE transposase domain-containing protein n=1 Tax=Cymbomonas tetramitiformis TaxID=36881 RepID=A0AAE0GJY4_9CHLO|nr:hypothetical protein CYMTET_12528 [Cymbomonas tetramitiformis]